MIQAATEKISLPLSRRFACKTLFRQKNSRKLEDANLYHFSQASQRLFHYSPDVIQAFGDLSERSNTLVCEILVNDHTGSGRLSTDRHQEHHLFKELKQSSDLTDLIRGNSAMETFTHQVLDLPPKRKTGESILCNGL